MDTLAARIHRLIEAQCDSNERDASAPRFNWPGEYIPTLERWERASERAAPDPVSRDGTRGRSLHGRISTQFVEWMMGLPEGHVTARGLSRGAELKLLGNGVVPQQAAHAYAELNRRRHQDTAGQ